MSKSRRLSKEETIALKDARETRKSVHLGKAVRKVRHHYNALTRAHLAQLVEGAEYL